MTPTDIWPMHRHDLPPSTPRNTDRCTANADDFVNLLALSGG
jgi:hypothetical protein